MAVNRVDFGGNTLIDLTGDTLESAEQLLKGIIAHAKDGSVITGQMEAGGGGGYNFGDTAFEVVSGSFTTNEKITCKQLYPKESPINLPFVYHPDAKDQRGRWFVMWDVTPDSAINNNNSEIYSNAEKNQILAVLQFYVYSTSGRDRGLYIYKDSSGLSGGNGYWFGDAISVYTSDSTRFFGAGRTYQWVAWKTKAVYDT